MYVSPSFLNSQGLTESQALIMYGLLFVNPINAVWYRADYIFGAFVLFGIASYLGSYLVSNMFRRGGFFAALGIHIVLSVIYLISYIANQYGSSADARQDSTCSLFLEFVFQAGS